MHAFITTVYNIWDRPDTVDSNLIRMWPLFWYDVSIEVLHVWICQSWGFSKPLNLVNVRHLHWYPFLIKTHIMSFVTFSVFAKTSPLNEKSLIIGCLRQVSKKLIISKFKPKSLVFYQLCIIYIFNIKYSLIFLFLADVKRICRF